MGESEQNPTIARLVKKIKELEETITKSDSEKGAIKSELDKLKTELEEANSWIL
jgi:peptidoglycan hydrolase CwlO-like protein